MSREKLAEVAGISVPTLKKMEKVNHPGRIYATNYRKVADALKASPDDLIRNDYPENKNGPKRSAYPSRTENLDNCISIYRRKNFLTYELLASHLGVTSRERARQICAINVPLKKHILSLATHENVSVEEFIIKYSKKEIKFI
jgi:DNA-binding Xre family transcriptional regulator